MKKIIILLLLTSFVFQATSVQAETVDLAKLQSQVDALRAYVERLSVVWNPATQKSLPDATIKTIIQNGVSWLVASQENDGHFAYEYQPYLDEYRTDDNMVRQAGSLYALGEVARKSTIQNIETTRAIEKAISYQTSLSPVHEFEGKTIACATNNVHSDLCKLGTTALALIGILDYVAVHPEKKALYSERIDAYVGYIIASKKVSGGFYEVYSTKSGFVGEGESSFSNGEALLALVRYYHYKHDLEVKKIIDDTYAYLKVQPYDANLYLWMMAALKDMYTLWPNPDYISLATSFTSWRLQLGAFSHNSPHNYCPVIEGYASAYTLVQQSTSTAVVQNLRTEINFWNTKHAGLQLGTAELLRVSMLNGKVSFNTIPNVAQSRGGFLTGEIEPTQRIDFTQHCIHAYLQTFVDIDGQKL